MGVQGIQQNPGNRRQKVQKQSRTDLDSNPSSVTLQLHALDKSCHFSESELPHP